jgi:hypothetical protein
MVLRDLPAEEAHCADIFGGRRLDARGLQALAGVFVDDERTVSLRDRTEKPRFGVGDGFELCGGDLVAENV